MSKEYITTGKAAKKLGQSEAKIRKLFKSGKLKGYVETTNTRADTKIFMISVESIDRYIAERTPAW